MSERFETAMGARNVRHDTRVLGVLTSIWCDAHHAGRERRVVVTGAARLGVYGRRPPVLCAECETHLAYGEKRRAHCPKDPKPFCAHCDTHCYSSAEAEWQRMMMRYAGRRSWRRGLLLDGVRHMLEARKWRRVAARSGAAGQLD